MEKVYNQQTQANPHLLSVGRRDQIGGQRSSRLEIERSREASTGRPPTSVVPDSEVGIGAQRTLKGDTATVASFISVQSPDDLNELGGRNRPLWSGQPGVLGSQPLCLSSSPGQGLQNHTQRCRRAQPAGEHCHSHPRSGWRLVHGRPVRSYLKPEHEHIHPTHAYTTHMVHGHGMSHAARMHAICK